ARGPGHADQGNRGAAPAQAPAIRSEAAPASAPACTRRAGDTTPCPRHRIGTCRSHKRARTRVLLQSPERQGDRTEDQRMSTTTTARTHAVADRVHELDWQALTAELDERGFAVTERVYTSEECGRLADLFDGQGFRS